MSFAAVFVYAFSLFLYLVYTIFANNKTKIDGTSAKIVKLTFAFGWYYLCSELQRMEIDMKNDGFTFRKRMNSFRYAFNGIKLLLRYEHNAWIHCLAAVAVVAAGLFFGLSRMEWVAVTLAIGTVLAAEAVNSSIEALADFVSPAYQEAIKRTKDLAAGAVLLMAIAAAMVGLLIFLPKILALFS